MRPMRPGAKRVLPTLAGLALLAACAGEPASPEAEIRALFERAESAIEARDVKPVKEMISERYADRRGRDKAALKGVLAGHLLGHRVVYLFVQVKEIEIASPDAARAVVVVAMTGVPVESAEALVTVTGQIYRIEVELVREDGDWRVIGVDESPARLDAFG